MAEKPIKRPRDPIQLAKLIGDIATGQVDDTISDEKNAAAVELGRKGGAIGGKRRMDSLSKEERVALAKKAAEARRIKRLIEQASAERPAVPKKKIKISV